MPKAAPRRCSEPQCWNWAGADGKCDRHKRPAWQNPSAHTRLVKDRARWRRVRNEVLRRDKFICQWCGGDATEADHLISPGEGGALYDPSNLVASCHECNQARAVEQSRRAKRRKNGR